MKIRYATTLAFAVAGVITVSAPVWAQTGGGSTAVNRARPGRVVNDSHITQNAAQQEATDATAAYNAANAADAVAAKNLADVLDQRQSDFDKSPELLADKQAVTDASTDNDAAKQAVLATLKDKPAYVAAVAKATAAHHKIDSIRASNGMPSQVSDAAQAAMQDDTAVSKMENDACTADPAYQTAHAKLVAATKALKDLKTKYTRDFSTDPAVVAAKKTKSDADLLVAKDKGVMDAKVNYIHSNHPDVYYNNNVYYGP